MDLRRKQQEPRFVHLTHIFFICSTITFGSMLPLLSSTFVCQPITIFKCFSFISGFRQKQTNGHFLQHLVNSVNKLVVQHAVHITTIKHKLQKQQKIIDKLEKKYTEDKKKVEAKHKEDTERLEKKHTEYIKRIEKKHAEDTSKIEKNTSENIKRLKDSIELKQDKKGHPDDIQKIKQKQSELETKHDENKKKQDDEITKVTTKCTGDFKELRDEVETKRNADQKKGSSEMSAIRSKDNYDIQRLRSKYIVNYNINKFYLSDFLSKLRLHCSKWK